MPEILDNIHIWVFLVNSESVLLLALVKYMLCSHFTQIYIFLYFLKAENPCFATKNCWNSSYICVFVLPKKRRKLFHKNLHNSGMVGRRKLPDPSLNCIFNALSIGVQYTLSFQWTNFGLRCLLIDWKKLWVGLGVNWWRWLEMLVANLMIIWFCPKLDKFYYIGDMN